jgi:hypothetical protein
MTGEMWVATEVTQMKHAPILKLKESSGDSCIVKSLLQQPTV